MTQPCSIMPHDLTDNGDRHIRMVYSANDWWFPLWELYEILGVMDAPSLPRPKPEWLERKVFPSLFGPEELAAIHSGGALQLTAASGSREAAMLLRRLAGRGFCAGQEGLMFADRALAAVPDEYRHWKLVKKDLDDMGVRFRRLMNYMTYCCRNGSGFRHVEKMRMADAGINQAFTFMLKGAECLAEAAEITCEMLNEGEQERIGRNGTE